jgi:hypothetical protein
MHNPVLVRPDPAVLPGVPVGVGVIPEGEHQAVHAGIGGERLVFLKIENNRSVAGENQKRIRRRKLLPGQKAGASLPTRRAVNRNDLDIPPRRSKLVFQEIAQKVLFATKGDGVSR